MNLADYQDVFSNFLKVKIRSKSPLELYDPIAYIFQSGGKRIRASLILMSVDSFEGDCTRGLDAALAIELFHNFTLLHDDIMDNSLLRRGRETVHKNWDINTAILSGDVMMILANQNLEAYEGEVYKKLMVLFQKTAIEVCEGQRYDLDFKKLKSITIPQYLKMIRLKTAVLIAMALEMGAIISGSSTDDAEAFYQYGLYLGLIFQLQDDYLDAFGDCKSFGKKIGMDIIENKKTFLYLTAIEDLNMEDSEKLKKYYSKNTLDEEKKIREVVHLFKKADVTKHVRKQISNYTDKALNHLKKVNILEDSKKKFVELALSLLDRQA